MQKMHIATKPKIPLRTSIEKEIEKESRKLQPRVTTESYNRELQKIARRAAGKLTGRGLGKLFK